MYYSKTAALDRHVCELHRIITKVEPKAPQPGKNTEITKSKMSKRELTNRIERLVLLAYTLRRKTTNEPFVPATEQEWAHLYMNGMCVKKYYTCQGRQVYVPKKIEDSTGRGCSDRSGKYNTYLTDCGGKGYGGGGGSGGGGGGGGELVSNVITHFIEGKIDNKEIFNNEIKKAVEKDIKIFNNKKFFPDSEMKINYENLLFIIGFLLGLKLLIQNRTDNTFNDTKMYKLNKNNTTDPELEAYLRKGKTIISENQFKKIESNLAEYNELFNKAKNIFDELKSIPQDQVNEKRGDEAEFVKKILEFLIFLENDESNNNEDTLKKYRDIEENYKKESEKPEKNMYVIMLPPFLNIFYQPISVETEVDLYEYSDTLLS